MLSFFYTRDPAYWDADDDPNHHNEAWMTQLPDDQSIAQISIPGTHNTMAHYGFPWAWCQSLPLRTQMLIGVRFFDIRCRHYGDNLPIHHEIYYQKTSLPHVLEEVIKYLNQYPSEAIVMRIREEYKAADNTRSFLESLRACLRCFPQDKLWLQNVVPTVAQCRGKIVILDNFSGGTMGIDWRRTDLEDTWRTDPDDKWSKVSAHIMKAQSSTSDEFFITFSSFTNGWVTFPYRLAMSINPKLHSLVAAKKGKLGVIVSDFPGPQLINDIIASNFA